MPFSITEGNVPLELRQTNQWVIWNLIGKTETFKGKKVPYRVSNPSFRASSTNPKTWGSFAAAVAMARLQRYSGIGFVFTEDLGYIAVDIDVFDKKAEKAIEIFKDKTYIEKSFNGKGFHIICCGKMPDFPLKGIEVYNTGRFFAITGVEFNGTPEINQCQDELAKLYQLYKRPDDEIPETPKQTKKKVINSINWVDHLNLRVQDIGYPDNPTVGPNGEVRGGHPFHGSTTGGNYIINTHKNVWRCWRDGHNSGGGPLELFAVKHGIIRCEDAKKGCLRGKYREIAEALKRDGYELPLSQYELGRKFMESMKVVNV